MRARIVLRASEGVTATAIARETHACIQTVSKWWRRFDERGLDGLLDEPRPGQPRKLSDAQIEEVLLRTLESKPPADPILDSVGRFCKRINDSGHQSRFPIPCFFTLREELQAA